MSISIIICCYNSAKRLPQTLLHIAKQKIPETIACELIVVDNNCTDDTVAVVNSIWKELASSIPLTIIEEKTPGLSSARHKGVASANYEYIIFCDDDNWLEENYCKTVFEVLDTYKQIGAGTVILAHSVVNPKAKIGKFNTFVSGVTIGHDAVVGDYNLVATQAIIANVIMGSRNFVGINATTNNKITIGDDCQIGMASNVVKDVPSGTKCFGNPAKAVNTPKRLK